MTKKQRKNTSVYSNQPRRKKNIDHGRLFASRIILTTVFVLIGLAAVFYFGNLSLDEILPAHLANSLHQIFPEFADSPDTEESPKTSQHPSPKNGTIPDAAGSFEALRPRTGQLTAIVLDVGQGNSVFVQSPNGSTMLVDAGERTSQDRLLNYLKQLGVRKIDVLVATHPHSDHIGGMKAVLQSFDVGTIYMPRVEHTSSTYIQLLQQIKDMGKKIKTAKGGPNARIPFDSAVDVQVLAPLHDQYKSLNDYSVVLRISYGTQSILLTGDAEYTSESQMLQKEENDLQSTVLLLGHHGSSTSTGKNFLNTVQPSIGIISCGADNDYKHPHNEVLSRLHNRDIPVYQTDLQGCIAVFFSENDYEILPQHNEKKRK